MNLFTSYRPDSFLQGQAFHTSRKHFRRSTSIQQSSSSSTFKARPVLITKIKRQPINYSVVITRRSMKDKLIQVMILNAANTTPRKEDSREKEEQKLQIAKPHKSNKSKLNQKHMMTQSDFRQNSFEIIPIILRKRPTIKELEEEARISRMKSECFKQSISFRREQKQISSLRYGLQRISKRRKELMQKRMDNKTTRFLGQQIAPW